MRETAAVFGVTRLGSKVRPALGAGIKTLEASGRCRMEDDRVWLPG